MIAPLKRLENLLTDLASREEGDVRKAELEHALRVCQAQIEMVERGLED